MAEEKSLRQFLNFLLQLAEVFEAEIDPVMQSLGFCCGRKHTYSPQVRSNFQNIVADNSPVFLSSSNLVESFKPLQLKQILLTKLPIKPPISKA